jgi:23S rRNA (cytosine1962-C5)-methyltransferase
MGDGPRVREVLLKDGRDRSSRRRHPWLLSGAVSVEPGLQAAGELVRVVAPGGEVLGHGHYSPHSQIRVRLVAFGKEEPVADWLAVRIGEAVARRAEDPLLAGTDAVRLVNAEGDGLPGLVIDRYADVAVVRLATAGMAGARDEIAGALFERAGVRTVFERADAVAARRDGFAPRSGVLAGAPLAGPIAIDERGRRYEVDAAAGQKTGFYLDQRDARDLVERLAAGRRVLDLFAYTGGFAAAAARGGATSVTAVDSSAEALERAKAHVEANAPEPGACAAEFVTGDAFRFVRETGEQWDVLVVDPPPLARRRGDVAKAGRAYKDVVLHALRRARPGAHVLAFRCSHHVSSDLFRKIVFGASLDAGRPLQVLATLGAPVDHPVSLDHPEGEYLSGLLLRA